MKKNLLGYLLLALFFSMPSMAMASNYLGQLCWQAHLTRNDDGPIDVTSTLKLDVTTMGGSSMIVQGSMSFGDEPLIFTGGGQIIEDEVILTMDYSQQHADSYRDSGIWQMRINKSNLNGSLWNNYLFFNKDTGENGQGWGFGTVTYIPCP